jgi:transcriptional regulator with XRE-family HTH domain
MTSIFDVALGSKIRSLRRSRGLSLTELGTIVGVSYQQVQKYESGRSEMSAARVWDIAQALGVDVTAVFSAASVGLDKKSTGAVAGEGNLVTRREVRNLVAEYSRLPPGVRVQFGKMARSFISHQI